jgi:hypothetical protein
VAAPLTTSSMSATGPTATSLMNSLPHSRTSPNGSTLFTNDGGTVVEQQAAGRTSGGKFLLVDGKHPTCEVVASSS